MSMAPTELIELRSNNRHHQGVQRLAAAVRTLRQNLKEEGLPGIGGTAEPSPPISSANPYLYVFVKAKLPRTLFQKLLDKLLAEKRSIDGDPNLEADLYLRAAWAGRTFQLPDQVDEARGAADQLPPSTDACTGG